VKKNRDLSSAVILPAASTAPVGAPVADPPKGSVRRFPRRTNHLVLKVFWDDNFIDRFIYRQNINDSRGRVACNDP
jgi:hypothetical protein